MSGQILPTRADRFDKLAPEAEAKWSRFVKMNQELYVTLLGLVVEEVKLDYCRMRMPFKTALNQAAGVVHGGAIAGLLDSVVVPVVGGPLPSNARFSTVDMHVQRLRPKLESAGEMIETVRGFGYRLKAAQPRSA